MGPLAGPVGVHVWRRCCSSTRNPPFWALQSGAAAVGGAVGAGMLGRTLTHIPEQLEARTSGLPAEATGRVLLGK